MRSKLHLSEMSAKIISSWITPVPLISVKECQDMISTGQKLLMNKFPIWPLNPDMPLFSPKSIFPKSDFSCWIGCTKVNKSLGYFSTNPRTLVIKYLWEALYDTGCTLHLIKLNGFSLKPLLLNFYSLSCFLQLLLQPLLQAFSHTTKALFMALKRYVSKNRAKSFVLITL